MPTAEVRPTHVQDELSVSEGVLPKLINSPNSNANDPDRAHPSSNCEGEVNSNLRHPIDIEHTKLKVRFKDTSLDVRTFTNLNHNRLWQSACLAKQMPRHENGKLVHNYFTNFA